MFLTDFLKHHSGVFLVSLFLSRKEQSYHSDIEDSLIIFTQICLCLIYKISISIKFRKDDEFWKQNSYFSLGSQELVLGCKIKLM